jgi:hypothetical protein
VDDDYSGGGDDDDDDDDADDDDKPQMPQATVDDLPAHHSVLQAEGDNDTWPSSDVPLLPGSKVAMASINAAGLSRSSHSSGAQTPQKPRQQVTSDEELRRISTEGSLSTSVFRTTSKPKMPLRQVNNDVSVAALSTSLHIQSNLNTTTGAPKIPRRLISLEDDVEKGPPMKRSGTITLDAGADNNTDDLGSKIDILVTSSDIKGKDEKGDDGNVAYNEDAEESVTAGEGADFLEIPTLQLGQFAPTEFPPPQLLNFVNHNTSMSTLDESNNSHLYPSAFAGQPKHRLLSVTRTSSNSTAPTTTSTLSGPGADSTTFTIPTRQASNSERRQRVQAGKDGMDAAEMQSKAEFVIPEEPEEAPRQDGDEDSAEYSSDSSTDASNERLSSYAVICNCPVM